MERPTRTSASDPLRIAEIRIDGGGVVGVSLCPGKKQSWGQAGCWDRDLDADLDVVSTWGATDCVTLLEPHELVVLKVERLPEAVRARGMRWWHLPIPDGQAPDPAWLSRWRREVGPVLQRRLDATDGRVFVHCMGGLGRAGTVAAMLLIGRGADADEAMSRVRAARPGAIETAAQEAFLRRVGSRRGS